MEKKRITRVIHRVLLCAPLIFVSSFLLAVLARVAELGYWPDMRYTEYGSDAPRTIVIVIYQVTFLSIPVNIGLFIYRGFYLKKKILKDVIIFAFGLGLMVLLVYGNLWSTFTWFLG